MSKDKELGQAFTPSNIIDIILNEIQYSTENILNKKILEPSFGTGNFLIKIYEKIIEYCLYIELPKDEIYTQLLNVYGIEIDKDLYTKTINSIYKLFDKYELKHITLNLYNQDFLKYNSDIKFDYIVGNPPYVRIHNMNETIKENIKKYHFSSGMSELYVVFFEKSIDLLNDEGKLGFITPNSYFKNKSQQNFRDFLIDKKLIYKIIDYKSEKVFNNIGTYTAITLLEKSKWNNNIIYQYNNLKEMIYGYNIDLSQYKNKQWIFNSPEDTEFLEEINEKENKLSDLCSVQYGISTNKDNIYINTISKTEDDDIVLFNNYKIEKDILLEAIKGSRYTGDSDKYIIFPYKYIENGYKPLTELELKNKYPLTYKYLLDNKSILLQRKMSDNLDWFLFARTQGLSTSNNTKLVFKQHIKETQKNIKCYQLSDKTIVYSGIYIIPKDINKIDTIKNIIESEDFCRYCKLIGKDMSGNYKVITPNQIMNYKYS